MKGNEWTINPLEDFFPPNGLIANPQGLKVVQFFPIFSHFFVFGFWTLKPKREVLSGKDLLN